MVALTGAACTGDSDATPDPSTSPSKQPTGSEKPRTLEFGVYGNAEEVAAYQSVVDSFNASSATREVELVSWPDHEAALADVLAGNAPDVFLTSRIDLDQLVEAEALQPVSLLLDERGVDFGDRFSRDAVDAFAFADDLQCMAYSVSPMVIYYNTDLVDFERMERRGLDVPTVDSRRQPRALDARGVLRRRPVRLPARRRPRSLDRPDAHRPGPVHLLR